MHYKTLKNQLIKLGAKSPELQKDIRPILDKISSGNESLRDFEKRLDTLKREFSALPNNRDLLTLMRDIEKDYKDFKVQFSRVNNRPVLKKRGFKPLASLKDNLEILEVLFDVLVDSVTVEVMDYSKENEIRYLIGTIGRVAPFLGPIWVDREDDLIRWHEKW